MDRYNSTHDELTGMSHNESQHEFAGRMRLRTKNLVLSTIRIVENLPNCNLNRVIKDQLIRSVCSVGSNYRAACRARSKAEFFSKISITIEEWDESIYWLEILMESDSSDHSHVKSIIKEATEILSILSTARKTLSKSN